MTDRRYVRLDDGAPAGALVPFDRAHEVYLVDCDGCGREMGSRADCNLNADVFRARSPVNARAQFDVCDDCLMTLPPWILARLAEYGLQLPGAAADNQGATRDLVKLAFGPDD